MVSHVTAFSVYHILSDLPILTQEISQIYLYSPLSTYNRPLKFYICSSFLTGGLLYYFLKLKDDHFVEYSFYNAILLLRNL